MSKPKEKVTLILDSRVSSINNGDVVEFDGDEYLVMNMDASSVEGYIGSTGIVFVDDYPKIVVTLQLYHGFPDGS